MKPRFVLRLDLNNDGNSVEIRAECSGNLKESSQATYLESTLKKVFQKSKLIDLNGYLFNPFEINNVSPELSMVPTFKYRLETMFGDYRVSIKNTILFSPSQNLYSIVMTMIEKGVRESHIRKVLIGQRIKINYPGWYRYFKITKFIEGSTLENHETEIDGRKVKLYDYFT